jgi:phosphatidylglycerol:prolipoprotein diacylglycerol transferase
MHPVLFEVGSIIVYSYGFFIALGIVTGMAYLVVGGKKEVGLTFDQANALFLFIFFAAIIGGKLFLFFEQPSTYLQEPEKLFTGSGFVFYGSFLLAVPTMWLFFKRYRLDPYRMLDVMAITTCFVHMFGRVGCFLAGCCYGKPTGSFTGVTFSDPACYAEPLNTPLYPTQLFEAFYILLVMIFLFVLKNRRRFHGQLFLSYLMLYAVGRIIIEFFRGDVGRGFVIEDYLSHSQFIALGVLGAVVFVYFRWRKTMSLSSKP